MSNGGDEFRAQIIEALRRLEAGLQQSVAIKEQRASAGESLGAVVEFINSLEWMQRQGLAAPLQNLRWALRRVGFLVGLKESDPEAKRRTTAFVEKLQQLGWIIGHNISIEYRWFSDNLTEVRTYAQELSSWQPDVLVATSTPAVKELSQQSRATIPIVFAIVTDPISRGLLGI